MRTEVFTFADAETGQPCKAAVTAETGGVCIKPEGTGTFDSDCGPIYLVVQNGRPVLYAFAELDEVDLAYACSIHKSQGSEYPAVVILLATQHFKLLQRNLLYTAVTRARKLVCIVGSSKAIHLAIRNNEVRERRTTLSQRLKLKA